MDQQPAGAAAGWQADPALPVEDSIVVDLPVEQVWAAFCDVAGWPRWNPCIRWARVRGGELRDGASLYWVFGPIKPWLPYRLPAVARIVEVEPRRRVTWEVTRLPGFAARHSYRFDDVGDGRCRFGSWEVATGPTYRALRAFWLAHFRYVCRESLAGAAALAREPEAGVRLVPYGRPTAAPPLLVIPGIDGSVGSVAPLVERLSAGRQVWLADYRREVNADLEGLAGEIVAAARAGVDGPVDVLGQSIGSILAAQVAGLLGDGVRRVVLVGTFTRLRWRLLRVGAALTRSTPRPLYRVTAGPLMALVCGPVGDGRGHPFLSTSADSDPKAVARRTRWQVGRDFSADLHAVEQPTLVLMGAADRFVPDVDAEVDKLRRLLADRPAEVRTIRDAGHVLLPSAAVATAVAAVEHFLA